MFERSLKRRQSRDAARLFSSASLVTVLQDRYQWAIRTYVEACDEWHWRELIDAVVERATPDLLDFDLSVAPPTRRSFSDGRPGFAIRYSGDPILWYLSPIPLQVPRGMETLKGFRLAGGGEAEYPHFEIAGAELLLLCSNDEISAFVDLIESTLVNQWQAIWAFERNLEMHLRALARPPGTRPNALTSVPPELLN